MRISPLKLSLCCVFLISACHPAPPLNTPEGIAAPSASAPSPSVPPPPPSQNVSQPADPAPSEPATSPRISVKTIAGIRFDGVTFDARGHRLQVIDQPEGPGSRYQSAEDLARGSGALLAINAGFFTPEGAPLGLAISGGKTSGAWNSASSLGSGIYRETSGGDMFITRRDSRSSVSSSRQLLQAGPLLIENGKPVSGLDPEKTALRSIILTDGRSGWWIGKTSPCTLAALARALSSGSPAPWKTRTALNLDGGRSTDLHISGKIPGGPLNYRTFLNRPVRNFLILTPR